MLSQWMAMLIGNKYIIAKYGDNGWHVAEQILARDDIEAADYLHRNYDQEWHLIDEEQLNEFEVEWSSRV
jgi:hypothetical protein